MGKEDSLMVAEALILISNQIRRAELKKQIEGNAVLFLVEISRANYPQVVSSLEVLESLVKLGGLTNEIEPMNVSVLLTELERINSAVRRGSLQSIRQKSKLPDPARVDLREIFESHAESSAKEAPTPLKEEVKEEPLEAKSNPAVRRGSPQAVRPFDATPTYVKTSMDRQGKQESNPAIRQKSSQKIRQSKIVNAIKSSEGSKVMLKDIISAIPEVSERTIRYDIKKLCDQGLVVRVGISGPGIHYVIK
jgi:hypothetical protein